MNDTTAVKAVQAKWLENLPPLRLGACLGLLAAAMLLAAALVGGVAIALKGAVVLPAVAVAATTCWLGSSLALISTSRIGQGPNTPLYILGLGLVFNGAAPFSLGLLLSRMGGPLAEAGVFGLIVIFLQVALATETLLALCLIKSPR